MSLKSVTTQPIILTKPIVLVGLMGCGKSSVGVRVAKFLSVPFLDTDRVIEEREGFSVSEIFEYKGESYFREREKATIEELLSMPPQVIATGGGAFVSDEVRAIIQERAVSVWLDADFDILLERVSRRNTRPLLEKGNKAEILHDLMLKRLPFYKQAHVRVKSEDAPHQVMVNRVVGGVKEFLDAHE